MYEQYLILINLPLNALILLIKEEIVGREWLGWERGLIILVSFLEKKTTRRLCLLLFLMMYFCAILVMPTLRKSHSRGVMNMRAEVSYHLQKGQCSTHHGKERKGRWLLVCNVFSASGLWLAVTKSNIRNT